MLNTHNIQKLEIPQTGMPSADKINLETTGQEKKVPLGSESSASRQGCILGLQHHTAAHLMTPAVTLTLQ